MGLLKKMMASLSPPSAPKRLPVPLPDDGSMDSPPGQTWSSSGSSSCSSPSPTTPSPRSSPVAFRVPSSKLSGGRAGTPLETVHNVSRYSSPDPAEKKARSRRVSSPAGIEILKPTPRHAYMQQLPAITVMPVSTPPMPDLQRPPLKGILKTPRPATAAPPPTGATSPPPTVVRPSSAAPAPPADRIALHWQLLPHDARPFVPNSGYKQLYYDITKPPSTIKIRDYSKGPMYKLSREEVAAYLQKDVCNSYKLPSMVIRCDKVPGRDIRITAKDGKSVRCQDVFDGLYAFFDEVMTPDERCEYIQSMEDVLRIDAAFLRRCDNSHRAVPRAEQYAGIRWVDLLEGNTAFRGLRRPMRNGRGREMYWLVEFGPCEPPS
ncbi:hypothetical protein C8Q77DRAFT_1158925 [Trametes polyzona]|nr:hypothetical protein C8Q77DRAFT_1158925 [Trametes polyzona]